MVFLCWECFLVETYSKLSARKIGHCCVLHKFSDNAYSIELLDRLGISNTFNVANLY